jgi:hypothetical protein
VFEPPEAHPYHQRQPALESRAWLLPKSLLVDAPCLKEACLLPASLSISSVCIQGYSDSPAEGLEKLVHDLKEVPNLKLPVLQFGRIGCDHSEQAELIQLR